VVVVDWDDVWWCGVVDVLCEGAVRCEWVVG